jgi:hypothetical protein
MSGPGGYTVSWQVAIGGRLREAAHTADELVEAEPMYTRKLHDGSIRNLRVLAPSGRDVTKAFFR